MDDGGITYWSDVFTLQTWREAQAQGLTVSGFRARQISRAERLKQGDILICYLYGHSRFIGALEVQSEAYLADQPRIWAVDPFPARVNVRPLVVLTPETGVPVQSVIDRLEILQ